MSSDALAITLDRVKFYARDALVTLTQCICKPDATLKINGRSYKIDKLLGEGGFAFVYLISDISSGRQCALKKILISSGQEGVKTAMREVEAYRRFKHPNIIRILDSAVVQDEGGEGKIIYLFLPYYPRGNMQDAISTASITGVKMAESRILQIFHDTCLAVRAMHHYRLPQITANYPPTREEDSLLAPMNDVPGSDDHSAVMDEGEPIPYAHRDIKPANIMIADDGAAILMDFGSTIKARIQVSTRQKALLEQDIAAEHSTMPYRAPELFDVKTGRTLDEKVDIWSLGCTLYALAYGHSPFEVDGQSIAMAVGSGRYRHPGGYSEAFVSLVDAMLVVEPDKRPNIQDVLQLTESILNLP